MDLIKIGKYIAGKRKDHGLTQRQLAEKLGMSDKSVSKWERGICLPDVSVYSDLCQILGISINEFLAGEDIVHEDLIQKSEENIIGIAVESKRKQSHLKTIIYLLLAISVLAISIIGVSMYRSSRPQNFIAPVEKCHRLFPPFGFRITRVIRLIETKKALLPQRMCTYAAGKGHEKSRGLIRVSVSGYVTNYLIFRKRELMFIPCRTQTKNSTRNHSC